MHRLPKIKRVFKIPEHKQKKKYIGTFGQPVQNTVIQVQQSFEQRFSYLNSIKINSNCVGIKLKFSAFTSDILMSMVFKCIKQFLFKSLSHINHFHLL